MFFCEFSEIFNNTYFTEYFRNASSARSVKAIYLIVLKNRPGHAICRYVVRHGCRLKYTVILCELFYARKNVMRDPINNKRAYYLRTTRSRYASRLEEQEGYL